MRCLCVCSPFLHHSARFSFVSRCHVIISHTWISDLWESATRRHSLHPSDVVAVSLFCSLCARPRVGRQIAIDPLVLWVLWFNFARSICHQRWNLRLLHSQVKLRSNNISNGVWFLLASASPLQLSLEEMHKGIKWTNFLFWWACNSRCRGGSPAFHNIWIRHFHILFAQPFRMTDELSTVMDALSTSCIFQQLKHKPEFFSLR